MNSTRRKSLMKEMDVSTLREMRRQGMTNKQIAESLDISVTTVYRYIGRMSQDQKYAELQRKADVVPMAALRPDIETETDGMEDEAVNDNRATDSTMTEARQAPVQATRLRVVSARYRLQGTFSPTVSTPRAMRSRCPETS